MPRISVIVPVFNAEKYIAATLSSIAVQSFSDFDVYIIDDCSTDGSAAIIQNFCATDQRFKYYRSPSNFGGPAGPRNIGVERSIGQFVAFCDADDLWAPFKLEVQLRIAEACGADVVSALTKDFKDGDEIEPLQLPPGTIPLAPITHRKLLLKNWIALSSVMVNRKALLAAGVFDTSRAYIAVEDFDMWLRITAQGGAIVKIDMPLVHYRRSPSSISADKHMMVRKALAVIGEDYRRRGIYGLFRLLRPVHWLLYVGTSAWMRLVRREL